MKRFQRNLSALALGLSSLALLIGCGKEGATDFTQIKHHTQHELGRKYVALDGDKVAGDDKDDKPKIEIVVVPVEVLKVDVDTKLKDAYVAAWDKAEVAVQAANKEIKAQPTKEKALELLKKKEAELKPLFDAEAKAADAINASLKPQLEKMDFYKAVAKKAKDGKVIMKVLDSDRGQLIVGFFDKEPTLKDGDYVPEPLEIKAIVLKK